ncbi:DLAT [Nymphon striatum]|nr:DLAT [Nymphon striatum]
MPRLSDTMEEGTVAAWLKNVGDKIEEGDILAEIETDKATMEFESFNEGTLLHIGVAEGDTAPVDVLLAIIGDEGEDISGLLNGSATPTEVKEEPAAVSEAVPAASSEAAEIPEGVEVITMPRLSDTMEEGTVAAWLKKVGDTVEEGDILAEIETDKATMEFESFYSGTLLYIGIQEGESSPVDEVLAVIGPEGTDVDAVLKGSASGASNSAPSEEKKVEETKEVKTDTVSETVSANDGKRIFASPLAKKIAKDKGVNLADVKGTGDHGRIIKKDIENYQPSAQTTTPVAVSAPKEVSTTNAVSATPIINLPVGQEGSEEVKNSQMRKVIAKRLSESKFTAPHYYLNIEVDMSNAIASRKKINDLPETKVSFNDLVVKACAMALIKHPQVNTTWGDTAMVYHQHVHIGVAVAVPDGLMVPVLKFADQMSLTQIGGSVKDLAGKARNKKLTPAEMEGIGAIVEKPVVRNGEIVVGNTYEIHTKGSNGKNGSSGTKAVDEDKASNASGGANETGTREGLIAYNMVGVIPGNDEDLKNEYIILGAHYDHIGVTKSESDDTIANGANDNASGTATVLELARYFGSTKTNKRSIIFALFSAEEQGLLGSKHLAQKLRDQNLNLYTMLNFEMVGVPMVGKDHLMYLTGYELSNLAEVSNSYSDVKVAGFLPKAKEFNLFKRSDNLPFHELFNVPSQTYSTFDFTNFEHYHKVGDEASLMDFRSYGQCGQ